MTAAPRLGTIKGGGIPRAGVTAMGRSILVLLAAVALVAGAAGLYGSGDPWEIGVAAAATHPGHHQLIPEIISDVAAGDGASLSGVRGLDVFAAGAGLYVVAAASSGDAILVINVTDPYEPRIISAVVDDGSTVLDGASGVDVIRIGSGLYAVVASASDDGLQVIDLTDPADPVPVAGLADDGRVALAGAYDVDAFAAGAGTYAVVASASDDGLQVIDLTSPADPVPVASITDDQVMALDGAVAVDTIRIGSGTYAVVASPNDDGLQIIDLTSPAEPVPVAGLTDDDTVHLRGVRGVAALGLGLGTYAVAAAPGDDGLQVVEITDPAEPVPIARVPGDDDDDAHAILRDASALDTFMMDGGTYAMVATADGIVVVDLADPAGPVPVGAAQNNSTAALRGASAIKTFQVAGYVYAAVAVPDGGGAIRIVSMGEMDTIPPALSSATWMPANRTISLVFSEPLDHAATIYPEMTILGESANLTLADISSRTAAGGAIAITLSLEQEAALGVPEAVQLSEGAVRDISGNPVPPTSLAVTLGDFVPPAASSAAWLPANRTISLVFSEPLDHAATIYPGMTILGESANLTLADISSRMAAGGTIEATLSLAQEAALGVPEAVQLSEGAVRDISGNPVPPTSLAVTLDDFVPPAVSSATYELGTGLLTISFSEPLNHTATIYRDIAVAGPVHRYTLGEISVGTALGTTIEATLDAAQVEAVGSAPVLDVMEGAVRDIWDNPIGLARGLAVTVLDPDDAPVLVSSSYNTGTGILAMTFSEPLNATTIHYDRMAVRDAGQSFGGLILDSVTSRTLDADSATMMTLMLSTAQRQMINDMAAPQLDIGAGAIADVAGNGILAASDRDITVVDGIPPTISLAAYEPATGIIRITFSEPLGPAITYSGMVLAGESGSVALDDVSTREHSAETITATLDAAQRTTLGTTTIITLSVSEGAVADVSGNGIARTTVRVAADDGIPPALVSSSYNTGTGILVITFSEPLNATTIHYDRIAVRDAGQSFGGLILDSVTSRTLDADSATMMTLMLSDAQRQMINDMATPQLDIGAGAIADIDGNGILAAPDRDITVVDGIPPTISLAAYEPATGIIRITFSEPLGPVITYSGMVLAGESGSVALDDVSPREHSAETITATLDAAQRTTLGGTTTITLSVSEGAVADVAGNGILAVPDRSITITDGIPPTITSAAYEPGTGLLTITFSEPLGPAITYSGMVLAGESGSVALDDVSTRDHSAETITATLDAAQRTTLGGTTTITLSVSEGAVADVVGNGIARATVTVAVTDGIPPALVSSSYNTGTGILVITFNEPLDGTAIHYDRMAVRDAGRSTGGLSLDDIATRTVDSSSATMTLTLSAAQRTTVNGMASPQLDIGAGAVADIAGNEILAAPDRSITITDGIPPTVVSAAYNTGTGILVITFSEPLGSAVDYSGVSVVGPTGSVTLDDVASRSHSTDTITATLDAAQRSTAGDSPTLSVSGGAVADVSGNSISPASNIQIAVETPPVVIIPADTPPAPPANTPPTANAGDDQTVTEGDTVSLNGTLSSDPEDGNSLTYSWTHTSGPTVSLTGAATATPSFEAPNVGETRDIVITLTVTDSGSRIATDAVTIRVNDVDNTPPTADAGNNQNVTEGDTVMLTGAASDTDPEDTLAYQWTHNATFTITIQDSTALNATFTAPPVSADTPVLFTLNVTDGTAHTTDTATIIIADTPNAAPTANAGDDQTVTEGDTVSLNGTLSSDPEDGNSLTYSWTHTSGPTVSLTGAATATPSFEAPNVGETRDIVITLTVTDSGSRIATDAVTIRVNDVDNTPPTADAGNNQNVTEGDTVMLTGAASDTDPEDTLAYQWTHNATFTITIQDSTALNATFTAPPVSADTPVLFTLNVTDGTAHTTDTATIIIADTPNAAPTANAGDDQTVTEGDTVSLNGTLSSDPEDGNSLTYSWTHTSGPTVSLTGAATATPSFEAPNVGETRDIVITLTVTDSGSRIATDAVTIRVNDVDNTPPTADAGNNQNVTEGDTVMLTGAASDTDPEDTLAYQWTHNATFTITIQDSTALNATFTAPPVSADTPVLFTLNVTDGTAHTTDTATIIIADTPNAAPTANAGDDQTVTEGDTVSLNGTLSSDPEDGNSLTYSWTHTSGPTVSLTGAATATPSFEAPNVGETRDIVITLTVTDSGSRIATDAVTIRVNDVDNTPPTADAGNNQNVTEGDTVMLTGAASDTDPEDTLAYQWTHNATFTITIQDSTALNATFTAPPVSADTPVLFTLNVTDGTAHTTDTATIVIADSPNAAPTANAGRP